MMHRAFPLLVNILVARAASFRVHEKVRGNDPVHVRIRRRRKEWGFGSSALLIHGGGHSQRIVYAARRVGKAFLIERSARREQNQKRQGILVSAPETQPSATALLGALPYIGNQRGQPKPRRADVRPERPAVIRGVSGFH